MVDTFVKVSTRPPETVTPVKPEPVRSGNPIARKLGRKAWNLVRNSLSILLFLGVWETVPRVGLVDPVFLPPFSDVAVALKDLASSGELWTDAQASLIRSFSGFGISLALGVPIGLLLGWYTPLATFFNPLLEVFRNT